MQQGPCCLAQAGHMPCMTARHKMWFAVKGGAPGASGWQKHCAPCAPSFCRPPTRVPAGPERPRRALPHQVWHLRHPPPAQDGQQPHCACVRGYDRAQVGGCARVRAGPPLPACAIAQACACVCVRKLAYAPWRLTQEHSVAAAACKALQQHKCPFCMARTTAGRRRSGKATLAPKLACLRCGCASSNVVHTLGALVRACLPRVCLCVLISTPELACCRCRCLCTHEHLHTLVRAC